MGQPFQFIHIVVKCLKVATYNVEMIILGAWLQKCFENIYFSFWYWPLSNQQTKKTGLKKSNMFCTLILPPSWRLQSEQMSNLNVPWLNIYQRKQMTKLDNKIWICLECYNFFYAQPQLMLSRRL